MTGKEKHIAILGAGLAGLMTAYYASERGFRVSVFEARTTAQSASAGLVGAMSPHMPENWNEKKEYQFQSLKMAQEFWPLIEAKTAISTGYKNAGRWQAIRSEAELEKAKMRQKASLQSWRGEASWSIMLPETQPFRHSPLGIIEDTLAAQIFPKQAMRALLQACLDQGVKVYEQRPVTRFGSGFVEADGRISCDFVVVAGGYDAWPFLRPFFRHKYGASFGEGTKGQAVLVELEEDWPFPMITGDGYYVVPHSLRILGLGSTSERYWCSRDVDEGADALLERVASETMLPAFKVLQKWSGIRPRAYRPDPLIGEIEPNIYVHAGGFKTGYSFVNKLSYDLVTKLLGDNLQFPVNFFEENL